LGQAEEFVKPVMEVSILHDALKLCWDKILELVSLMKKKKEGCNSQYLQVLLVQSEKLVNHV